MKKLATSVLLLFTLTLFADSAFAQGKPTYPWQSLGYDSTWIAALKSRFRGQLQIPFGTMVLGDSTLPVSTILDVRSTTKGVRLAPMSSAQMAAISLPVDGLMVYNTSTHAYNWYNNTAWVELGSFPQTTFTLSLPIDSGKIDTIPHLITGVSSVVVDKVSAKFNGKYFDVSLRPMYSDATNMYFNLRHFNSDTFKIFYRKP